MPNQQPPNMKHLPLLFAACVSALTASAGWENALRPVGKPAAPVVLVKSGKPAASIQLPTAPTPPEQKAAADLQHWIQDITGAKLPVVTGDVTGNTITLSTDPALGDEGYAISVQRGHVSLTGGRTRGVINAVYAMLEEDLGCRFYTRDSIRMPHTNTLAVSLVPRSYAPMLKLRDPFYFSAFDADWSLRNRCNSPYAPVPESSGGRMDYDGMFVHTAAQLVPADRYFKDHPDYFAAQTNGTRNTSQLCATHPEVGRIATEYVRQTLRDHPETEIVSVSKNDNTDVCHCQRCEKLRVDEGSDFACQLVLVNQVAAMVAREFPGKTVDTLAYLETIQVPKTARPAPNVAVRLCNDSVGAWTYPFTPAGRCEVAKIATAWGAAHPRLYIWDYTVNFSHYLAPMPNVDVMAANIRFWVKNHAEGVMLQGGYQGPAEQDELKSWVTAKLLWNPALSEQALMRDFIWGHYGKAAPAMEYYYAVLQRSLEEHAKKMASPPGGIRYGMDAPFLTKQFITAATALLDRAEVLAGQDEALLRAIEKARLPILYVQCVRGQGFVGEAYASVVSDFERIARREGVKYLQEGGGDFETKLAGFKKQIPQPTKAK